MISEFLGLEIGEFIKIVCALVQISLHLHNCIVHVTEMALLRSFKFDCDVRLE